MATSTYLSNPALTINAINLSDQCTSAVITSVNTAQNASTFGSLDSFYVSGTTNNTFECELFMSYAASETYATLAALVGTQTTITISPTAAGLATPSATAPKFTLSNTYLESLPLINATLGELSSISLSFQGGTLTTAIA
tara:strand:+ start:87 stop:506 length:420 start_codon:yes stop_codon:yes gene_type:complete